MSAKTAKADTEIKYECQNKIKILVIVDGKAETVYVHIA